MKRTCPVLLIVCVIGILGVNPRRDPMKLACPLRLALCEAFRRAKPRILRTLRHDFPTAPAEQIEDALSQGLLSLLETTERPEASAARAWKTGGLEAPERLLSKAAWRALRGDHRLLRNRRERCEDRLPEPLDREHPLALLEARRAHQTIFRLVPQAGRRFGARKSDVLKAALQDRLDSGDTDIEVAERHGVGRSQLCRARGWIEAELGA